MSDSHLNNTPESPDFEQLYRTLIHNLPTFGIFATDVNGRISSWNKGVEANLGYTEQEFVGHSIEVIFTAEDRRKGAPASEMERARRDGHAMDRRWHLRKNGTTFFVDGVMTALTDDEGRVVGFSKIMRDATREHLAEKRLGSALEYAECIVDTILEPMLVLGADLRVISANRTFYRDFELEPDVTEGKLLHELGDGQWDIPQLRELLEEILPKQSTIEGFEVQHNVPGIGLRTMLFNARKLWREINHTQLILLAIDDVTERKQAEAALVESERQRRVIMNAAPAIISYLDRDLRYKWANEAYERWFGLSPADMAGKTVPEIYPPELFAEMYPHMQKVLSGEPVAYDLAIARPGRDVRTLQITYTPDRDDAGQVQGFVVLGSDITEHKRAADALRESEEFTRSILASSPDCVKVLDLEGRLLSANESFCQQMELDDASVCMNWPWPDLWGENKQAAQNAVAVAAAGNIGNFEGYCATSKGTPKWWEVVVAPIRDVAGQPVRLLSLSRDITQRRRAEDERERLLQELERSNDELSEFAHVAAHDLQTPLRTILSYAQLLERHAKGKLDETGCEFLQMVKDGGARMDQLVRALLNYAQVGQGTPALREVSMKAIVDGVRDNLKASIAESGADIGCSELPVVAGDEVRLLQLVQNLISNGIKYARPGVPPRIRIAADRLDRAWQLSVRDNGQGISPEYLEQVFQPFRRLHGYDVPGTGMGLAVARKIVERQGGRLWVESTPGQGSTFYFTIPAGPASRSPSERMCATLSEAWIEEG